MVQGDLETTISYIKKGLITQNSSYMTIQKSMDSIAKSMDKVRATFNVVAESLKKGEDVVEGEDGVTPQETDVVNDMTYGQTADD